MIQMIQYSFLMAKEDKMKDIIYKQDAIEAIYNTFSYAYCDNCENGLDYNEDLCEDCHRKYQNWSASKSTIEDTLNALPSAQPEDKCSECDAWNKYKNYPQSVQPEIVRCKDCKHADQYNHCDRVAFWNTEEDYCSKAERRTDE